MPRLRITLSIALAILSLVGCEKRTAVKDGFELISQPDMGPDSHPGVGLGYKGKPVWGNIDAHTFIADQNVNHYIHDGIFVFLISLPDNDAEHVRYDISPQLVAVRGTGPPVVLSERILGRPINKFGDGVVWKLAPSDAGVHVEFAPDADAPKSTSSHDVTWAQISQWLDTPDSVAPRIVKPLGTYRLLPPLNSATTTASGTK